MTAAAQTPQAAARDAYRASVTAGVPLSARQLAEQFDRSPRWGRQVIADAVAADRPNGSHPAPPPLPAPVEAAATTTEAPMVAATRQPARPWLDSVITLAVAVVAAGASYGHMFEVAQMAGEPLWIARAFPVTVDGLVLAALRRGESGRFWLVLGIAVSVAANVLAQYPAWAADAGPVCPPGRPWRCMAHTGCTAGGRGDEQQLLGCARPRPLEAAPTRALRRPGGPRRVLRCPRRRGIGLLRGGLLAGLNPNDGTIGWVELLARVDQANTTAREIVGTELIYLPGEDDDADDEDALDDDDPGVGW